MHRSSMVHDLRSRAQVNMKGNYTEAYLKRHRGAPPSVDWEAGVVVPVGKGRDVALDTWSPRANW